MSNRMTRPSTWFLGLNQQHSFLDIVRSSKSTLPVSQGFLESSSASLINPRHHRIATDQVSLRLSASSITGLDDEAVLTLFTKGFFGRLGVLNRKIDNAGRRFEVVASKIFRYGL